MQCLPWSPRNVCSTYLRTLHNTGLSLPQPESSSSRLAKNGIKTPIVPEQILETLTSEQF